jgi:hypothetical protein
MQYQSNQFAAPVHIIKEKKRYERPNHCGGLHVLFQGTMTEFKADHIEETVFLLAVVVRNPFYTAVKQERRHMAAFLSSSCASHPATQRPVRR